MKRLDMVFISDFQPTEKILINRGLCSFVRGKPVPSSWRSGVTFPLIKIEKFKPNPLNEKECFGFVYSECFGFGDNFYLCKSVAYEHLLLKIVNKESED